MQITCPSCGRTAEVYRADTVERIPFHDQWSTPVSMTFRHVMVDVRDVVLEGLCRDCEGNNDDTTRTVH